MTTNPRHTNSLQKQKLANEYLHERKAWSFCKAHTTWLRSRLLRVSLLHCSRLPEKHTKGKRKADVKLRLFPKALIKCDTKQFGGSAFRAYFFNKKRKTKQINCLKKSYCGVMLFDEMKQVWCIQGIHIHVFINIKYCQAKWKENKDICTKNVSTSGLPWWRSG